MPEGITSTACMHSMEYAHVHNTVMVYGKKTCRNIVSGKEEKGAITSPNLITYSITTFPKATSCNRKCDLTCPTKNYFNIQKHVGLFTLTTIMNPDNHNNNSKQSKITLRCLHNNCKHTPTSLVFTFDTRSQHLDVLLTNLLILNNLTCWNKYTSTSAVSHLYQHRFP